MSFVCVLPPVCQCRGQGWGEVHDPGRLCPEVPRTTHSDPPQPQNCATHLRCRRHHKGRVRISTSAYILSSLNTLLLMHV